jgi:glycosyltransferase involved in cell wall biosynthesis
MVVAVLTYRRPADLAALLPLLIAQLDDVGMPAGVLVVDNDPDGGAREQVEGLGEPRVRYVHEPTPGIAPARNRALDEAGTADILVFIDDDERPVRGWLRSLLDTYQVTKPAGVVGPVVSSFPDDPDPWILAGGFFRRRRLPTGTEVAVAATNNLLLDLASVRERGLRFDEHRALTGDEDTLFTRQLTDSGGRLVWCSEALVHDIVPPERMTRRWVLTRAFRMGGSASAVELLVARSARLRAMARVRQMLLGCSRLGAGVARIAVGLITSSQARKAAGARNLARGLGLIAGAIGYVHAQYRRTS